jgi:hypothetical protein
MSARGRARLGLFLLLTAACGGEAPAPSPADAARSEDEAAQEELAEEGAAEARAWLRDPAHAVFEGRKDEVAAVVEDLYGRGARAVHVTGVESLGDSKVTASLVVTLPAEAEARRRVFERLATFQRQIGGPAARDTGQKYQKLTLD